MFEVRGLPIFVDEVEILKELKAQVYEQQGKEIFKKIKRSGSNIMICCPIHKDGQERKPSCGISTKTIKDHPAGTVHCLACGYKDSLAGMVTKIFEESSNSFGENWLMENFVTGESFERPDLIKPVVRPNLLNILNKDQNTQKYVTEEELSKYRFYHPYMWKRKLSPEIVEKFDVGYQKDFVLETKNDDNTITKWPPVECLTFPVRDVQGRCLFVSRRAIYNKTFFLPSDMEKPVYGLYELPPNCKEVIICESVINALTCITYGRPAVALFGTGDAAQYKQLNNLPARQFILGLDPDKAGALGAEKLKKALKGKLLTKLIVPPDTDINDCSKEQFYQLTEIRL